MPTVCPTCKKTYDEGIKYCLECGASLIGVETSTPEKRTKTVVLQAKDHAKVESVKTDSKPNAMAPPANVGVDSFLEGQRQHEDEEAIRSILQELASSIKSLDASLKVTSDTNLLLLKKLYELESRLSASKP